MYGRVRGWGDRAVLPDGGKLSTLQCNAQGSLHLLTLPESWGYGAFLYKQCSFSGRGSSSTQCMRWSCEEEERDAEWIGRLISIGSAGIEHISRNFKQVERGITTSRCNPPAEKTRRWRAWVLGLAPTCQLPVQNTKKVQHPMWLENSPSTGLLTLKAVCLPVDWIMLLQVKLLITLKNSGPRLNRMGKIYVYALN